jgi:hypothetical protein
MRLISCAPWIALLLAIIFAPTGAFGQGSRDCEIAFASTQTASDISFLDNTVDPNSEFRSFHGKQSRGPRGQRVYAPDPSALSDLAREMNLTESEADQLARFAAERDNMRALQERMGQEQTQCLYASEGVKDDARLARVLESSLGDLRADSEGLEKQASESIRIYRELNAQLGKQRADDLFGKIRNRSSEAQKSVFTNQRAQNKKARSDAKQRCEQGLRDCRFPEGLPANCAPYLGMSAKDILKVCPHPKRMEK